MKKTTGHIQLNRDNRGITLVEIIVSLLILMIIVVPLLSSFVTASRTNKKAKDITYAHTAGENVMEAVKLLGVEEVAREFNNCSSRGFLIVPGGNNTNHYEVSGPSLSVVTDENGRKLYRPLTGTGSYQYRVENVAEGTDRYDIDVTISSVDAYSDPNSYQFADLTAFSSDSVAVINPVIQGSSYDNKALSYFSNMNKNIMNDRYSAVCKDIDDYNREVYDTYEEARKTNPDAVLGPVQTYPPTTDYEPLTPEAVSACISKKVVVKLNERTDETGQIIYVLNSELVYSCRNKGDANGQPLFSEDTVSYPVDGTDPADWIYREPYTGFCHNQLYASLDTLLLVYKPFNDVNNLNKETIELVLDTSEKKDVYIALQGAEGIDYGNAPTHPKLIINDVRNSGLVLYSQADFDISGATIPAEDIHKSLISDLPAGNRLYNLSVKVYEHGSDYSNLVAQIDSTLLDE